MQIVSFHNGNIDPEVIIYQRWVFEHFGYVIEQVHTDLPHGEAIDEYLKKPFDKIAIFDIDCIPLMRFNSRAEIMCAYGDIYAAAQQANHIPNSGVYASPAFMCFDATLYKSLGRPSFVADEFGDVGYKISKAYSESKGALIRLLWPIHVEVPKWDLGDSSCFGLGTTYSYAENEPEIYHAFESRMGNGGMFVRKCKEVLNGNRI